LIAFHVCLKENAVPICLDTELSTGAEMSCYLAVLDGGITGLGVAPRPKLLIAGDIIGLC
jgi:hypothetical protein